MKEPREPRNPRQHPFEMTIILLKNYWYNTIGVSLNFWFPMDTTEFEVERSWIARGKVR